MAKTSAVRTVDLRPLAFKPDEDYSLDRVTYYHDCRFRLEWAATEAGIDTSGIVGAQGRRTNGKGISLARKRFQVGSLKLRSKSWVARWREDVIESGNTVRRIRKSLVIGTKSEFPTQKLARRKLEVMLAPINSVGYRPQRVATVTDFAERWKTEVLSQRKPSTKAAAEGHLENYIVPELGRLRLEELTVERQQQFINKLSARTWKNGRKMSRKTLDNVLGTLSSMLKKAMIWGYAVEPVDKRKLDFSSSMRERPKRRFFSADEIRRIVLAANEPLATICLLAAMTGMREGELFGLKVDDLDFERKTIHVRRSVWRGRIQSTKSESSDRFLHMPDALATRLKSYLDTHPNESGLVFASRAGTPLRAAHVVPRKLHPLLDKLGIERAGFHAFRHSHSTLLVELGAPVTVAQAQLGHSDLTTTMRVYSHVLPQTQREAVDRLADVLDPTGPKT